MARIVVRCQYTGHYMFTGLDSSHVRYAQGGRVFCPYCAADHVWSSNEARVDEPRARNQSKKKPLVRQAG